ncbi:unnamed protein product [Rotaria sp. Silwood2]|nr:unnamed protein product [Rotaria sp. Silwood2]
MADPSFYVDSNTGQEYRVGGCLISDEPSDLPKFGTFRLVSDAQLPPSVDLRQLMTPIEIQGKTNSWLVYRVLGAYEFLIMKNHRKHVDVSRLFIYYNARSKEGLNERTMKDNGTFIRSGIAALKEFGCCKESLYPFNVTHINRKPPSQCYEEGRKYRIVDAMSINPDLNEMKACLAEGYPFAFGLHIFESFNQAQQNEGRVPMPKPDLEMQHAQHGWHAMLAGDEGYCYIPYEYMTNPQHCKDLHSIKVISDDSRRRRQQPNNIINNTWTWNNNKDAKFYIPPAYTDTFFDYMFFWKFNETFDFNGSNASTAQTTQSRPDRAAAEASSDSPRILWIDKKSNETSNVEKQSSIEKQG